MPCFNILSKLMPCFKKNDKKANKNTSNNSINNSDNNP